MTKALGPGALVWSSFEGAAPDGTFLDGIRSGHLGGVLLFAENADPSGGVRGPIALIQEAARAGGLPPVPIAIDQEGGVVVRLHRLRLPSAMALGATGDAALVRRTARAMGAALRREGITVNTAPVCDLNSDPRNPVIGTRAFGDDPARVAPLVAAWVEGSQRAGVAAVAKHFPGHGATAHDSHHTTVEARVDRATLDTRELVPFRAAIDAGARGAMTAHVRYPALDDVIATLSPAIATTLLREGCGFSGVLFSDAFDMTGLTASGLPETLVPRAVAAGIDALLIAHDPGTRDAAWEWIATGVRAPRVAEAIARVGRLRAWCAEAAEEDSPAETVDALREEIAERSIALVGGALPRLGPRIRVAAIGLADGTARALESALHERLGGRLAFAAGAAPEGDGQLVVCTANERERDTASAVALIERAVIHLALGSPYDAGLAGPRPTLLTFGTPSSFSALARVLDGSLRPAGETPVRLELASC